MKFSTKTNYAAGTMCMGKAAQIAFLKSGRILRTKQDADSPHSLFAISQQKGQTEAAMHYLPCIVRHPDGMNPRTICPFNVISI